MLFKTAVESKKMLIKTVVESQTKLIKTAVESQKMLIKTDVESETKYLNWVFFPDSWKKIYKMSKKVILKNLSRGLNCS